MVTFETFNQARHTKEWNVDPDRWERLVKAWLRQQLAPQGSTPASPDLPGRGGGALPSGFDASRSGAVTAAVRRIRSAGASSMSRPRRPPETRMVSRARALSSSTVGEGCRWPSGEMPPST